MADNNNQEESKQTGSLDNYITQVVTDIGKPINKELFLDKIAMVPLKNHWESKSKKMR